MSTHDEARQQMVADQIEARGVTDEAVLAAMRRVPRHAFVHEQTAARAYHDNALPIGRRQTISQPYMVAAMTAALELQPTDRVLEIGTGSGYAAAILSEIAADVYTVERHQALAEQARKRLQAQGYEQVRVRHGDGTQGWPQHAPYDAIVVAAGGPEIPKPLCEQLAVGGRLVIPVGQQLRRQKLVRVRRTAPDNFDMETLMRVRFVPLIGRAGWDEADTD